MNGKHDAEVYKAFCLICKSPLTLKQIAHSGHAHVHHWEERAESDLDFHLCKGCKEGIDEAMKKGIKGLLKDMDDAIKSSTIFVNTLSKEVKKDEETGTDSDILYLSPV